MNAANGSERLVKGVQRRLQVGKRIIGISAGSLFRRPARIGRLLGVHEACPAALSRSGGSDLTFPLSSCSRLALCARLLHALVLKRIRLGAFRRHSFPSGEAGLAFCTVPSKTLHRTTDAALDRGTHAARGMLRDVRTVHVLLDSRHRVPLRCTGCRKSIRSCRGNGLLDLVESGDHALLFGLKARELGKKRLAFLLQGGSSIGRRIGNSG